MVICSSLVCPSQNEDTAKQAEQETAMAGLFNLCIIAQLLGQLVVHSCVLRCLTS